MNRNIFDSLSPLDHRYYASNTELLDSLGRYFSENALVRYQLRVEASLAETLAEFGVCSPAQAAVIGRACREVSPEDVYEEELKTHHNTRALVNCIARKAGEEARPFIHLTATSFDIVDTANTLRFKEANSEVILPGLLGLERTLILLARREKETPQIGRTHGQHAVPITFGFALAGYVARLGDRIELLELTGSRLRGKMSGAVGAYNAQSLVLNDPGAFERAFLERLGLKPASHSTQIVAPEFLTDYLHAVTSTMGVLANLADDFRHLQRSEIAEVAEEFSAGQVGSSTMPHKRNPWNFEHVKSLWKAFAPRMMTLYMDQISEHQRDLSNSASGRFVPEMPIGLALAADRLTRIMSRIVVDHERMGGNLKASGGRFMAEPLYILLAAAGHPDAHEAVRRLTLKSDETGRPLLELLQEDKTLARYAESLSPSGRKVLADPLQYLGESSRKTESVCEEWEQRLHITDNF